MRNMSFSLTTNQILDRGKTVTRRLGWRFLRLGDIVMAVEKAQGLKKDELIRRLGPIRITGLRLEPLERIDRADCLREGFDGPPDDFVAMFCRHMDCRPETIVNRIEFEYLARPEEQR